MYVPRAGRIAATAASAAALIVAVASCREPARPASSRNTLTLVPHVFRFANGHAEAAESGRLTVPENRDVPGSRTIDIAFVRFPSTSKTPGPPIFLAEGGPGLSSIDNTRNVMYPLLPVLRAAGDVVSFDQRGVDGHSRPALNCAETWDFPLDSVRTRDSLLALARVRSRSCAQFWTSRGVDLGAYNTNASADDIDALRAALRAERMTLLGGSYGSHLVLATVRRHGAKVERIIMNGVEGPDHTLKLPSNIQKQLENIGRLVAADPVMRGIIPDFVGLVRSVLARLEQAPVQTTVTDAATGTPVKVVLSRFDLQLLTAEGLGSSAFIRRLPAAYYDMSRGDFTWLAQGVLALSRQPFGRAMSFQMDCASGVSEGRLARVQREAGGTLLGNVADFPLQDACDAWVTHDLGPGFRGPLESSVPALFISGTIDGRTPVSNAEEIRAGFPNGIPIVVENAGHGDREMLMAAPEVREAIGAFLKGQTVSLRHAALPPLEFARPATAPPMHQPGR
jgi:pimeloyl-ACP methyl ester carboxylesterase